MKEREDILRMMREYFKAPVQVFPGTVKAVDEAKMMCTVEPVDGPEIFEVRLKAAIDEVKDGIVEFPKLNSTVLVGMIGNSMNTCFVVRCSEVDKVVFFGGQKGGLVNWPDVKTELDKTNEVVNALVQSLTQWTPVANDGGAALKTYATTQLSGKQVGNYTNKEDTKVLH